MHLGPQMLMILENFKIKKKAFGAIKICSELPKKNK
jgi:hypothetical protein